MLLSSLGIAKDKLATGGGQGGFTQSGEDSQATALNTTQNAIGGYDILGFSVDQWSQTFDSLDTTAEKLAAVTMVVGALGEAWGMYSDFLNRRDQVELQNFERTQDKKRQALERNLDKGFVNQRQYDEQVRALEEETEKRRNEAAYRQAKRDKEMALINVAINTASAIIGIWAQVPKFDFGISAGLLTSFVGGLGLAQAAMIGATPLPAKGFEDGFYGERPIRRTQDGKVFNAGYGGKPTSQLVDSPKYFLAGEGGKDFPEMIIDGRAFRNFRPDFKDALYREIGRAKGYENGYYPNKEKSESSGNDSLVAMLLEQNISLLQDLRDNPITAYLPRTMQNAKHLKEDIEQYQRLRNKNKR